MVAGINGRNAADDVTHTTASLTRSVDSPRQSAMASAATNLAQSPDLTGMMVRVVSLGDSGSDSESSGDSIESLQGQIDDVKSKLGTAQMRLNLANVSGMRGRMPAMYQRQVSELQTKLMNLEHRLEQIQ